MQTAIAEYSQTETALAGLRQRFAAVVFDVKSRDGMGQAKAARRELVSTRTALEAKRQELKAPLLERGRLIDDEAKRITGELLLLEKPIDDQIKAEEKRAAEEKAERERKEQERALAVQRRIQEIQCAPIEMVTAASGDIEIKIASIKAMEIKLDDFGSSTGLAESVRQVTLGQLQTLLVAAQKAPAVPVPPPATDRLTMAEIDALLPAAEAALCAEDAMLQILEIANDFQKYTDAAARGLIADIAAQFAIQE
jgi:colicin import membrane protein